MGAKSPYFWFNTYISQSHWCFQTCRWVWQQCFFFFVLVFVAWMFFLTSETNLLGQWLTFWTFGDSIFSRENQPFTLRPFIHCGAALGMVRDAQVDRQTSGETVIRGVFFLLDVDVVVDSVCLFQTWELLTWLYIQYGHNMVMSHYIDINVIRHLANNKMQGLYFLVILICKWYTPENKHGTWKYPLGKGETFTNHQFLGPCLF